MDIVLQVMDFASLVVGILIVLCLIKEKLLAWPLGVLFVFLSVPVLYNKGLFGYVALSLVGFLPMNLYGWYSWVTGKEGDEDLPITRATPISWAVLASICVVGVVAVTYAFELYLPDYKVNPLAVLDNSIFMMSMAAMWLTAHKKLENWIVWFVVNILTVYLYVVTGLIFLPILYVVYIGLAVWGFFEWRQSMAKAQNGEISGAST